MVRRVRVDSFLDSYYCAHPAKPLRTADCTRCRATRPRRRGKKLNITRGISTSNNDYRGVTIVGDSTRPSDFFHPLPRSCSPSLNLEKDSVNAAFCASYNSSRAKRGRREARKFLFSWYFYDCQPHSGAAAITSPLRPATAAQREIHTLPGVLREICKPRELYATRCTSSYAAEASADSVSALHRTRREQSARSRSACSAAVSSKRAVDAPSPPAERSAESEWNRSGIEDRLPPSSQPDHPSVSRPMRPLRK